MKPKSIKFARMTIHEANQRLLFQLYHLYDNREASNIADLVMEKITGWQRIDRVINKEVRLSDAMEKTLQVYIEKLSAHTPVQYVLGEAWFYGMKFTVNETVLIPRPETEELVEWIISELGDKHHQKQILDIGTGSGCIPVVLKKKMPGSDVSACDISSSALYIARFNAAAYQAAINFYELDILDIDQWNKFSSFDVIVSNPPYIPFNERNNMNDNVLRYEPHVALFVNNDDPLMFYRAIAEFGKKKLKPEGSIFVEIYEELAEQTAKVFKKYKNVVIRNDMQGKPRMLRVGGGRES